MLTHGLQDLMLAVRIFCGVEQQNVIAPLIGHPGDALEQQGEERVVEDLAATDVEVEVLSERAMLLGT